MTSCRVLLAVDLSYQTYRAAASHPTLTYAGQFTGGLYGFLVTLAKQIRVTGATRIVVCQDMKPYRRSLEYLAYKQLRKKSANEELKDAFNESTPLVIKALGVLGIPIMGYPGFEADDCMGWIAKTHRHRFDVIYAASNDSDLYQLLRFPTFKVIRGSEMSDVMDAARLATGPLGMTPAEYMLGQALQGTHNDVEGIPKVGPKTAFDAVKDPAKLRNLRERWASVIDRNLALQVLPHRDFPDATLPAMGKFNPRALYRFCADFDIEVSLSMLESFNHGGP